MKFRSFLVIAVTGLLLSGGTSLSYSSTLETSTWLGSTPAEACSMIKKLAEARAPVSGFGECQCSVAVKKSDGSPQSYECSIDVTYK